jgi:transmembrane sensor
MRLIAMSAETHEAQGGAMEAAIAWHVQMPAMDAARWADLVAWLEAAPEHQAAFDRVAAADRLLAGAGCANGLANRHRRCRRDEVVARGRWIALAASLAGVALWTVAPRDRQPTTFATAAGKMQTVRLAEGTAIVLNGDTRLARGMVNALSGWMAAKRCSRSAIAPMLRSRWRRAATALSMSEPCSTSGAMPGG